MIHVGIAGHRYLSSPKTRAFVAQQCLTILEQLQSRHTDATALSAIAEGADTLFAEAALSLDIPLNIVRPFEAYALDFVTAHTRKCYELLRAAAHTETKLGYVGRSDEAYLSAMKWVVGRSDVLIAAWNGLPPVGIGGTGDAVTQAILTNRTWIHLNVADLSVTFHSSKVSSANSGRFHPYGR